jgi:Protein of unknown function DUF262
MRGKMGLQEEIDTARAEIRTDGYSVSIGEWISIYEKKELDIHPEFQRYFRWSAKQKSRLIESILLGIPIPQIFVAQRPDGIWDVVDGLQRLSTIYELVGILRNEEGKRLPALTLQSTYYLPALVGRKWANDEDPKKSLTPAQQLLIKRSKIDVSIILKESDEAAKYELFQRLNTGGSMLSDQELRNSILVMLNKSLYEWIRQLSNDKNFVSCTGLSDRSSEEQYDMELVLRFVVFRKMKKSLLGNLGDVGEFLTDQATSLAKDKKFDYETEEEAFRTTFSVLNDQLGSDSFRRYDPVKNKFVGGFLVSAFEAVALGVGFNYRTVEQNANKVPQKVRLIWTDRKFTDYSGSGVRASSRVPRIVPFGRTLFAP